MRISLIPVLLASALSLAIVSAFPVKEVNGTSLEVSPEAAGGMLNNRQSKRPPLLDGVLKAAKDEANLLDIDKLPNFTQRIIRRMLQYSNHYNYVICREGRLHTTNFDGYQGLDWDQDKLSIMTKGNVYNFDVYALTSGTFTNNGKHGSENWEYGGRWTKSPDGSTITFLRR